MKKNKLYTITKYNRPAFMPHADYTNAYDLGGLVNGITGKLGGVFGGDKLMAKGSPNLGGSLLSAAGSAVGSLGRKIISGGYNSGAGNAVANVGGTVGGIVSNFNPVLGGIISAGTGIIGGGINALFGSKVDEKKLAAVNADIARGNNFVSKAGTFEDIKGPEAFMTDTNAYSSGILARGKAAHKNAELRDQLFNAMSFADRSIENNVNNIWGDMVNDAMFNYSAFGGPLNTFNGALGLMQNDKYIDAINNRSDAIMGKSNNTLGNPQTYFGDGGGIHISPSKKGTFTAAASKHGMGVQEFASKVLANKDDYSPAMVKKANFARNAAKWHAFGGELGTNGTDWTNGLLYVDAGGTHQQNPLGGVPVGFDQNGTPNLVEEGETIWNDYVFSDRIKVPKAMFHTLGLGGAMKKGLTFADASKKLAKESEQRPNDPISMAGLEMSLSKLAAVQEAERMKKQMRQYVGIENVAAYGGSMNSFPDGGSLKWLKKNHPDVKHIEEVAKAMDRYIEQHPGRVRMKGDVVPYMNAYSLIARGAGNLLSPREMPAENSPVSNSRINTGIIHGNEAAREQHFQELIDLGLSKEAALDLSYPEPELKRSKSPTTQSANEVEYAEQMDRRNRFQERMYSAVDDRARDLPEAMNPDYVSRYSNAHRAIQNARGISTPALTLDPVSVQQSTVPEAQAALQGIEPDALADVRTEEERNYLANFTPSELDAFNNMTQSQRQAVLRQAPQEIPARSIPSSGSGYAGTSGVRSNRNNGFTGDRAFAKSLDDLMNSTYGFTPSNGAQYIPYTGMSEADVRAVENDPRFQRWTNYVLDNFDNKDNATVQNYLQWLDSTAGGNHMFDSQGNLLPGARDYYTNARTQNHLMGYYHLTPENWEGSLQNGNDMEAPEPVARPERVDIAGSPDTDVVIGNTSEQAAGNNNGTENDNTGRPLEKNPRLLPTWMRYAPAVGGAIGVFGDLLGLTNRPDYTYADRLEAAANAAGYAPQVGYKPIGDYERYTPFDRLFYANQMQANARGTDRMLANTSSPSRAAGLLANAYNTNNALGNLYRQGDEYNLAQYQQVKDFNRRTNMFNSQMGLEADIANARYRQMAKNYQMEGLGRAAALRDAIDQRVGAARSANLTNLFNSLGNIGRENFTFNQINTDPSRVYGTGTRGNVFYWPREMQEEYQRGIEEEAQRLEEERKAASKACGGKMNRNKK